jgi:hypothetical protein
LLEMRHCIAKLNTAMLPHGRMPCLHGSVGCKNYTTHLADNCPVDAADPAAETEKANFCEYFDPNSSAYSGAANSLAKTAKAKLAELFGESLGSVDANVSTASPINSPLADAERERALDGLNRLFNRLVRGHSYFRLTSF